MPYFAKKATCAMGHRHDSKREAARCAELHILFRAGQIDALAYEPVFQVEINGRPVKMGNGHVMRYTADFAYIENGYTVWEDVKASNGHLSRDVPVKLALLRHLRPDIELRIVK